MIPPRTFTHPNLFKDDKFKCYCGKGFKATSKGYIERHISTCMVFANKEGIQIVVSESEKDKNDLLNDLIDLESCEDLCDFDDNSLEIVVTRQMNADSENDAYEEEYFYSISLDNDTSPSKSTTQIRLKPRSPANKRKKSSYN